MWNILILIFSQLLFTASDLTARYFLRDEGFTPDSLLKPWLLAYFVVRFLATIGQLYIFSLHSVGKTSALFGATAVILSNVLGFLILKETLSLREAFGITLAIISIFLLNFK
jgi:drug/metabolite transporter (DMT)-like permease